DHHSFLVQQALPTRLISQIHPYRHLLLHRLALRFGSADLFHSRSPFRASGTSWGAYRIPLGDRPSHSIWEVCAGKCGGFPSTLEWLRGASPYSNLPDGMTRPV